MDMQRENVADNERYAFLLGSALRNDNLDVFLCIYDSIIPKHLSNDQVEKIKERARYIAALPEEDFNGLVVKARSFSLAHNQPSSPCLPAVAMSTDGHHVIEMYVSDEEEEKQAKLSSAVPKLGLDMDTGDHPKDGFAVGMKDESGFTSSSPTEMEQRDCVPHCTTSSQTKAQSLEEGTSGKTKESSLCKIGKSVVVRELTTPHQYDEAVMVENDSESVESPRSDASSTREYQVTQLDGEDLENSTEMTTFTERRSYFHDDDSDENITHKYDRRSLAFKKNFMRVRASSTSPIRCSKLFTKGLSTSSSSPSSNTTSLDDSGPFSSFSYQTRHSADCRSTLSRVPLSSSSFRSSMHSYNLGGTCDTIVNDGKKKKKKKDREGRDENTREGENHKTLMSTDVNGNPLDRPSYLLMRQSPRVQESSSLGAGFHDRGPYASSNDDVAGRKGNFYDMGRKYEESNSSNGLKKTKKQRKVEEKVCSQHYPNFVGDTEDVDSLVNYINNDIDAKKLKGISVAGDSSRATTGSSQKKNPKKKDRTKTKQLLTTGVGENPEDCLTPASETTQFSASSLLSNSCVGEQVVRLQANKSGFVPVAEKVSEMGNSSVSEKPSDHGTRAGDGIDAVLDHIMPEDISAVQNTTSVLSCDKETNQLSCKSPLAGNAGKKAHQGEAKDKIKTKNSDKEDSGQTVDNSTRRSKPKASRNGSRTEIAPQLSSRDKKETKVFEQKDFKCKDLQEAELLSTLAKSDNQDADDSVSISMPVKETEGEFTLVSKRKRRFPASVRTRAVEAQFNNQNVKDASQPPFVSNKKSGHWETSGSRFTSRPSSITPLLSTVSAVTGPEIGERFQDFSHSAFPALNREDRDANVIKMLGPEARSLEDLQFGIGQHSSDRDSDKASTKSLPAVKAQRDRSGVGYPVSYAKMASGKIHRQSIDSKAESTSSNVDDPNMEELPLTPTTPMKWKGSPQERRHSIGSAPEELSKTSSLQRTGSQEIPRDKDASDKNASSLPGSVTMPVTKGLVQSNSTGSFAGSDADSARGSESEFAGEVATTPVCKKAQDHTCGTAVVTQVKAAVSVNQAIAIPSSLTVNNTTSSSVKDGPSTVPSRCRPKVCSKATNNGVKFSKSVIFCNGLGKNVRPTNCDVTFGDLPRIGYAEEKSSAAIEVTFGDFPRMYFAEENGTDTVTFKESSNELCTGSILSTGAGREKLSVNSGSNPVQLPVDSSSNTSSVSDIKFMSCDDDTTSSKEFGKSEDNSSAKSANCTVEEVVSSSKSSSSGNVSAFSSVYSFGMETSDPSSSNDSLSAKSDSSDVQIDSLKKHEKGPHIAGLNGVVSLQGKVPQSAGTPVGVPSISTPQKSVASSLHKSASQTSCTSDNSGESITFTYGYNIGDGLSRTAVFTMVSDVPTSQRQRSHVECASFLQRTWERNSKEAVYYKNNQ